MDTIFGLASGSGVSGVAVVRVSGPKSLLILNLLTKQHKDYKPRYAYYLPLYSKEGQLIDNALVLYFKGPKSFTGEDGVEFHIHGSVAVKEALFTVLLDEHKIRLAEPGEFTRRALENGKIDLTQVEGLYDLIHAQTKAQHHQALTQLNGALSKVYDLWREKLLKTLAYSEAAIDFSEEDLPEGFMETTKKDLLELVAEIKRHLKHSQGEKIRQGFTVTLSGCPNVGKSSLMNKIVQREVAITSSEAGTTRDVIEVSVDLKGLPVTFIDTAGLRDDTDNSVEKEGINRARSHLEKSDVKVLVLDATQIVVPNNFPFSNDTIVLLNKSDLAEAVSIPELSQFKQITISAKTEKGLDDFLTYLANTLKDKIKEAVPLTRVRHRSALTETLQALETALQSDELSLFSENLRTAVKGLSKIMGHTDVEDVLDVIFKDFCIGK